MTDVQFDLTAHITPKNQERARNELQDIADDLQVDADLEQSIRSAYLQERANEAAATYKAVENGANVFDQGMFITVRTDEKDHLRDAVQTVKECAPGRPGEPHAEDRDLPAGPRPPIRRAHRRQRVRPDIDRARWRRRRVTVLPTQRDDPRGGRRRVRHSQRQPEPRRHRPFSRDNGYAMFTVGDTGSGKSFSSSRTLSAPSSRARTASESSSNR